MLVYSKTLPELSYFGLHLLPNSVDLSYLGPVIVSYPIDLSYPAFWLEPNTGADTTIVLFEYRLQAETLAAAGVLVRSSTHQKCLHFKQASGTNSGENVVSDSS